MDEQVFERLALVLDYLDSVDSQVASIREQIEDMGKAGYDENEFADVNSDIEVLQYFVERVNGVFYGAWRTADELEKENE